MADPRNKSKYVQRDPDQRTTRRTVDDQINLCRAFVAHAHDTAKQGPPLTLYDHKPDALRFVCGNVSTDGTWFYSYHTPVAHVVSLVGTHHVSADQSNRVVHAPVLITDAHDYSATTQRQVSRLYREWCMYAQSNTTPGAKAVLAQRGMPSVIALPNITHIGRPANVVYLTAKADAWLCNAQNKRLGLANRVAAIHNFDIISDALGSALELLDNFAGGSYDPSLTLTPDQSAAASLILRLRDTVIPAVPLPALDQKTQDALDTIITLRAIAALDGN